MPNAGPPAVPGALPPLPTQPLVSIVIPAFNHARFLPESIESVLAQDYPRIQLIVIDDGSTDATADVLASYGGRLSWSRQPNAGQPAALNNGWRRAGGDLLGYLSADDVLAPEAVSAAVEAFRRCPGAVMSYGDFATIDSASRQTSRHLLRPDLDLAAILCNGYSPFGPGSFVRREVALAHPWDETLSRVPDFDAALRIARSGPLVHVPRILGFFRVHDSSISFRAPAVGVTEESIAVVQRFFSKRGDLPAAIVSLEARAVAMANISAAQGHLRAGRVLRGARCCVRAAALYPHVLLEPLAARVVVSGAIGQFLHRRRSRIRARQAAAAASLPHGPASETR
jgi:hypothetical protein